jgi:Collagen triple helix repeat (20 copies)
MNKAASPRVLAAALILLGTLLWANHAAAVDALLLQDTYVDNGTTGSKPPPNNSNYGAGTDLRVFKGNGRLGRTFMKFSLATLPPGTLASDVSHARLRFWLNTNSTVFGSISLSPITSRWDELTLKDTTTSTLTFGLPKLSDLPVNSINNFVSIDVTDWVKAWLSGTLVNEGIEIEASATATFLNLAFDSKESNLTSHEPRLEVSLSRTGPAGPPGPAGSPGPAGLAGPPGLQGASGAPGATGPMGPIGPIGLQGIPGANGTKWFTWTGAPDSALGALFDYYLDLTTGDVWQKVANESGPKWVAQGNIRGQQGPAGVDGSAGPPGSQGPIGPAGPAGVSGVAGTPGLVGPIGPMGLKGDAGPPGPAAVWPARIAPQGDLAMGEFTQGPMP